MLVRHALVTLLLAASAASLPAYVRNTFGGLPISRDDETNIVFAFAAGSEGGLLNANGEVWITAGSDPLGAVRLAAESWSAVESSRVNFATIRPMPVEANSNDGMHWIGFVDDPDIRSFVGDAVAVTSIAGFGQTLADTEIYFNPDSRNRDGVLIPFSTNGAPGTWDIQATALHEFGHALGADHTNILGATMYQAGSPGEVFSRRLRDDDIAFLVETYPTATGLGNFATISGVVRAMDGSPIVAGMVTALDSASGRAASGITGSDGSYEFLAPPSAAGHLIFVEPLDGPVFPFNVGLNSADASAPFQPTILGGPASPQLTPLAGGESMSIDLTVPDGPPALNPNLVGIMFDNGSFFAGRGPVELLSGETATVLLFGPGLETATEDDVSLVGANLRIVPDSFRSFPPDNVFDGSFGIAVEALAPPGPTQAAPAGALGTILIRTAESFAAYTAGLVVDSVATGAPTPVFSSDSVVNAASFAGPGVVPGEIVTIFGVDVGPAAQTPVTAFDPSTGRLPTSLAGVSVTFDGVPAPLFFVFDSQVNLQVPFELQGSNAAQVVLTFNGAPSAAVTLPVLPVRPGLFTVPGGGQAIVVNQDFSINSAQNPERRGNVVVAYATGQGMLSEAIPTGAPAAGNPLSHAINVSATVGGRPATVFFGGMTPDLVGLMQINLGIPADAPVGPAVPLVVNVNGAASQAGVTIAVVE